MLGNNSEIDMSHIVVKPRWDKIYKMFYKLTSNKEFITTRQLKRQENIDEQCCLIPWYFNKPRFLDYK